jgi:hypothetical protein
MESLEVYGAAAGGAPDGGKGAELPSFTPEQKRQIKKYTDTVLTVLDQIEDKVWELDEGKVADVIKVALGKCSEALDVLKEKLPRSDMQRRELARGCVSGIMTPAPAAGASNAYAPPEAVDEETVLAAAMLPEGRREQFVQTMEAAREGLRARMQQEWTQETRDKAEQDLVNHMLLMEAVIDEVKDVLESVDDDDLEQVCACGCCAGGSSGGGVGHCPRKHTHAHKRLLAHIMQMHINANSYVRASVCAGVCACAVASAICPQRVYLYVCVCGARAGGGAGGD